MNVIAIENAGNGASVALFHEKAQKSWCQSSLDTSKNAEQLLPMLDQLLEQAQLGRNDIQGVVFSQGPGGFTGLRVACGLAQGIALGLGVPVVPVSSLEASAFLSQSMIENGLMFVALDARMQEVYLAVYHIKAGKLQEHPVLSPCLMQSQDVMPWVQKQLPRWCLMSGLSPERVSCCLSGNAIIEYPDDFVLPSSQWVLGNTQWANADTLLTLGYKRLQKQGGVALESLAPLYLRDKVAFTSDERAQGWGGNPKIALPVLTSLEQQQAQLAQDLQKKGVWIRPIKMSDMPAVMAIEQEAHYSPWSEGMFFAALMHTQYRLWAMIDQEERVLGYAVQLFDPDVVNLMTIAISPEKQGKGLGRLLLRWLEVFMASQKNAPSVQLLEVRESNKSARSLYESMQYQQIGLRKGYYECEQGRENALVLQKNILE